MRSSKRRPARVTRSLVFDAEDRPVFWRLLDDLAISSLAHGTSLLLQEVSGSRFGTVLDADGAVVFRGEVMDLPASGLLLSGGIDGGYHEYDGNGVLVKQGLAGRDRVVLVHALGTAQAGTLERDWQLAAVDGGGFRLTDPVTGGSRVYRRDGTLSALRHPGSQFELELAVSENGVVDGVVRDLHGREVLRINAVELEPDGSVAAGDTTTGAAMSFDADGRLTAQAPAQ
jgi:hypothetical protein